MFSSISIISDINKHIAAGFTLPVVFHPNKQKSWYIIFLLINGICCRKKYHFSKPKQESHLCDIYGPANTESENSPNLASSLSKDHLVRAAEKGATDIMSPGITKDINTGRQNLETQWLVWKCCQVIPNDEILERLFYHPHTIAYAIIFTEQHNCFIYHFTDNQKDTLFEFLALDALLRVNIINAWLKIHCLWLGKSVS